MSNFGSSPIVTDCTFTGNSAHWGGGMDNSSGSHPIVTDCTFTGNSATGGIHSNSGHSEGGQGGAGGGMTNFEGSSPTLLRCSFLGNTAANDLGTDFVSGTEGGGMSNGHKSSPILTDCLFEGNTAMNRGGGMDNYDGSSPIVVGTIFRGNSARSGGAMSSSRTNSNPTLTGCRFEDNEAYIGDFGFGGKGGAINNGFSSPTVTDCLFSGNVAYRSGGAFYNSNSSPVIRDCTFIDNAVTSGSGSGGAILDFSSESIISNSFFLRNSASSGGALYSRNLTVMPGPSVTNCAFVGNTALVGAAMYTSDSPARVTNCSIANNVSRYWSGAIVGDSLNMPTVTNSILWGNEPREIEDAIVSFSVVDGGLSVGNVDGGGNIDLDPMFARFPSDGGDGWGDDPATLGLDEGANDDFGDLGLPSNSPCVDAGDNMAVPADLADLDDDMDVGERTPLDLGGVPRFIDDLDTIDTGVDDLPNYAAVVDIGAFESFLDCNDNGNPDETDPDCDSAFWASNGIPDACDIAECSGDLGCGDCNFNGVPDGCDIGGGEPDDNGNGVPDACEVVPPALLALETSVDKDRVISLIIPYNGLGVATALRVELTSLHKVTGFVPAESPDFSAYEGGYRFVNLIRDLGGKPVTRCLDSAAVGSYYACATLGCVPEYADWAGTFGGLPLHITGSAVVPDSVYRVSQLPAFCAGDEFACSSGSSDLSLATLRWGDADGSLTVDVADIVATVDRVKDVPGSMPEYMCYVRKQVLAPQSDSPNVSDIVMHVDAVKSAAYPFAISPCP